jgi:peptidyl-prolyl cis-trans isomerase SurA
MKRIQAVLAGMAAMFLCVSAQAAVADRIVAVVNGEVITLFELNKAVEPYQAGIVASTMGADREKLLAESRQNLLNRMIDDLLMDQQARRAGLTVSDDEVSNAFKDILTRRNLSQADFRKVLDREGITMDAYRKGVRDQIMRMKLVQREIKSKVAISDEEIGEYYRKHREDYEGTEAVRVRQIFLPLPKEEDPALKAKVQAEMGEIHKRLLNGEPFEQLSAQFSQGPAAAMGGDIGFMEKGMILPEVEEVAFNLPVQQLSGVIESSVGFHIIQVTDRRGAGFKPIESVRAEIRERLDMEKMEKKFQEWLDTLRGKSHIEIKL